MSQYLSVRGYGSGSGGRDRSRSPAGPRSRTPSPSRREETRGELRRDVLPEVRVLDQSQAHPFDTDLLPRQSRTFRFAVFVIHFAISLLESHSGRAALIQTGRTVWNNWNRLSRRNLAFREDLRRRPELMDQAVDRFLANIRADPPNIVVSSRLEGEGLVQRLPWVNVQDQFEVKWGAIFRLNKRIIDDAIDAADGGHTEEFQRFLFLMGMATAHELVHAFVGVLTGNETTLTPPPADFPRPGNPVSGADGESGRYFEGALTGFLVEAYRRPDHPLGNHQSGDLLAQALGRNGTIYCHLDRNWMLARLSLNFDANSFPAPVSSWRPTRLTRADTAMQDARRPPYGEDFGDRDVTDWITQVNAMPVVRVGSAELREIMDMVYRPGNIRARA